MNNFFILFATVDQVFSRTIFKEKIEVNQKNFLLDTMSSTIFYKFFHQRIQSTIHFDGTGINVFDLKHEIINQNQLGEGNDFDLKLYHLEQPDLEYDQDQDVIPRSSFVYAKRTPSAPRAGKFGNASRYVSGRPRINRKTLNNTSSVSGTANQQQQQPQQQQQQPIDDNVSEEDRIKMMFENQSNQWAHTQEELAQHKVIYNKPTQSTNPEDMPPPGYMCYRCGGRDHWIKNCPTNTDPNFEGKKLRKTTGIPRSYLKTVSREAAENSEDRQFTENENGELVDSQGNKYMITDTGEYVIAMADSKTWSNYQEKQQNAVMKAKKEFDDKIIECIEKENQTQFLNPLAPTKKILQPPVVQTPCCKLSDRLQKLRNINYNKGEIEQLLIDNDFHCPNCNTEDIFIDLLVPNEQLETDLSQFIAKKQEELGIEDPTTSMNNALKRSNEEGDDDDTKRQKLGFPSMPGMPMGAMPPFGFGPGMPAPPFPMMMPMMMPPPPPSANSGTNGSK